MTYKELKQITTGVNYYEVWVESKVCRDSDDGRYDEYQVVGLEFMSGDYYGNTCIVDLKKVDQKQSIFFLSPKWIRFPDGDPELSNPH